MNKLTDNNNKKGQANSKQISQNESAQILTLNVIDQKKFDEVTIKKDSGDVKVKFLYNYDSLRSKEKLGLDAKNAERFYFPTIDELSDNSKAALKDLVSVFIPGPDDMVLAVLGNKLLNRISGIGTALEVMEIIYKNPLPGELVDREDPATAWERFSYVSEYRTPKNQQPYDPLEKHNSKVREKMAKPALMPYSPIDPVYIENHPSNKPVEDYSSINWLQDMGNSVSPANDTTWAPFTQTNGQEQGQTVTHFERSIKKEAEKTTQVMDIFTLEEDTKKVFVKNLNDYGNLISK